MLCFKQVLRVSSQLLGMCGVWSVLVTVHESAGYMRKTQYKVKICFHFISCAEEVFLDDARLMGERNGYRYSSTMTVSTSLYCNDNCMQDDDR
jgi:hypothetical protein